jgi:Putative heavy-metal-binding
MEAVSTEVDSDAASDTTVAIPTIMAAIPTTTPGTRIAAVRITDAIEQQGAPRQWRPVAAARARRQRIISQKRHGSNRTIWMGRQATEIVMRTSTTHQIGGAPISTPIARIEAASNWHAVTGSDWTESWREHALRNLVRRAEDVDADAIVALEFEVDGNVNMVETGVSLSRIRAKGIAVKLFV